MEAYQGTEGSLRGNLATILRADRGAALRQAMRLAEASSIRMMLPLDWRPTTEALIAALGLE